MRYTLQMLLSLLFIGQMYLSMALMGLGFLPWMLVDRRGASAAVRLWCRWVRFSAHHMVGLRSEIRGTVPLDEVIVASKHQSFFDIILLCSVLPRPKFVMKKQLRRMPIVGWYAARIGCVPVDRGKGGQAIRDMLEHVKRNRHLAGQLIIYPQGTRVAPGVPLPYKVGTGLLYRDLGQTCVPAATNVGVFWPRHGILRKRGLAVAEFLDPIPPGMPLREFMEQLEARVEQASDALMAEAGFQLPPPS